jgi:hypothetical protein
MSSSAEVNAAIERVAPDVLALLADGVPRSRAAIITALAEQHPRGDIKRALARLAVLGTVEERAGKYTLAAPEAEQG